MKHVLVLAYYFPPLGGAGVQRTLKFVKHLREHGYESTVVTGPEADALHWAPPDPMLASEVPDNLTVLRVAGRRPRPSMRARGARWVGVTSPFERWWRREAARLGRDVVGEVDLVYASLSPFGTAAAAAAVARERGVPWVADLRDPWALDEWVVYPSALHRLLDKQRMRHALRLSDAVVANCPEAARALVADFPELASKRVVTIPNGWDSEDFEATVHPRGDGRFSVVYAGYAHVAAGRRRGVRRRLRALAGGAVPGLDVLPRSHVFLLEAVKLLGSEDPELARRVEIHLAGAAPEDDAGAEDLTVRRHGYLAHDRAVALVRSADALFLPMHDLAPGVRSRAVPGKTYEYLASERPIVAAVPDGDARDLLAGMPDVWLCRPRDVEAIASALTEIAGREARARPKRDIDRFERRRLASRLASLFDDVLAARDVG